MLYIVDGIWAGKNWDGTIEKWQMSPFNGDYPSSLFVPQDEVAIDAVCFDFLLRKLCYEINYRRWGYVFNPDCSPVNKVFLLKQKPGY